MPKSRFLPCCLALALAGPALAQDEAARWVLCPPGPWLEGIPNGGDRAQRAHAPVDLDAERVDVSDQRTYVLEGKVGVRRADQRLRADRVSYDTADRRYEAEGDVRYQDSDLRVHAARARGDLDADLTRVEEVRYELLTARGSGQAQSAEISGATGAFEQVTYSTCDPTDRFWELSANSIELDQEDGFGVARGAKLRIGGVPVLYLPWLSFPIDDRRRTGFLYPTLATSDNTGLDIRIPYYLNLAPNYDATLTARHMAQRGLMLGGEFRYLTPRHRGELAGSWLSNDETTGDDRSSGTFRHDGRLSQFWTVRANLNQVSDDRYFEDFGDSLAATSTSLLESTAGVYGRGAYWGASLVVQDWKVTDPFVPAASEPFRRLPRLLYEFERPLGEYLVVGFRGEGVRFDHEARPGANRVDLYPYIGAPVDRAGWFVHPELGYRYTGYELDAGHADSFDERSPDRALPVASLDTGLFFERPVGWFGRNLRQTLEPRLYYLYVPYEAQDELPILDTQELTFGFGQLFRRNRFSGADRQADANQATVAVTSRLYEDAGGRELARLTLGQIRYFRDLRVQMPGVPEDRREGSPLIAELELHLNDDWSLAVAEHYDLDEDRSVLSALRTQYRFGAGGVVNFAYRYRADLLEQVDASMLYPIDARWRLIGRWNYSLRDRSTLEAFAGVEWEGCCHAVRLLGRHYIRNREGEKNNGIYLELELKGLGAFGRRTGDLLERAILGYTR
ncbi:MAG TPA: LPS assembly protein LptD [Xanthomonadaceae bacterium]|nr:LPS assembly protein LptD [Xanthomonadaceae bacterium]